MPKNGSKTKNLHKKIEKILDDNKAEDIVIVDLKGKSAVADYMIVATGSSNRQIVGLADKIKNEIKPLTDGPFRTEGVDDGDWVLLDCGDVIVHLFRPEVREFYSIEKIWDTTESNPKVEKIVMPAE